MSNLLAKYGISPEREKEMWRRQNLADLLFHADLPLTKKIQMLEELEELAKSMHGGKLPKSPEQIEAEKVLARFTDSDA
ncbi:MAG: hypothetical protein ABIR71_00910 [Chthoniobacterales bacterium]